MTVIKSNCLSYGQHQALAWKHAMIACAFLQYFVSWSSLAFNFSAQSLGSKNDSRNVTSFFYAYLKGSSPALISAPSLIGFKKCHMPLIMSLQFITLVLWSSLSLALFSTELGFKKWSFDSRNVNSIYYARLMDIAGTFQHRAWVQKNVMVARMLLQFVMLVLWSSLALFSTELGYKKCHDSWNVTSIYLCLSMALFSTELGFKKCQW